MRLVSVRLRDPSLTIPCPTRKRNIVDGDVVDLDRPYWRRIAREGDILEVTEPSATSSVVVAAPPTTPSDPET